MKIAEIANKHIKIGKTSITVINTENNKTDGFVCHICKFNDLHTRERIKYLPALKRGGIWNSKIDALMDSVVIVENQLYYLHNLKPIETYIKLFEGIEGYEAEAKYHKKLLEIAEKMAECSVVIPCYIC